MITILVYASDKVELELDGNGEVKASYTYGSRLIKSETAYYVFNGYLDVVQLTDLDGIVIRDYDYDPYGVQLTDGEEDTNPFRYKGEYHDVGTGLIYLRARFYDPDLGRFISLDPARDGLNWYVYCGNNPINRADPSGTKSVVVIGIEIIKITIRDVQSAKAAAAAAKSSPSNSPTPMPSPSYQDLTEEQKIFIATIAGESIGQGAIAWESVGNVIMNRIGNREWRQYTTATDVIKNSGFDGYGSNEYKKAMDYLNNRNVDKQMYESLINIVMPVYNCTVEDITGGAQLFYSPRSMPNGNQPKWDFSKLTEITIKGIESNDFRFYKYK